MPKLKYFRKYILIIMSAIPIYILFSQITIFGDDAYNKANVKGGDTRPSFVRLASIFYMELEDNSKLCHVFYRKSKCFIFRYCD